MGLGSGRLGRLWAPCLEALSSYAAVRRYVQGPSFPVTCVGALVWASRVRGTAPPQSEASLAPTAEPVPGLETPRVWRRVTAPTHPVTACMCVFKALRPLSSKPLDFCVSPPLCHPSSAKSSTEPRWPVDPFSIYCGNKEWGGRGALGLASGRCWGQLGVTGSGPLSGPPAVVRIPGSSPGSASDHSQPS